MTLKEIQDVIAGVKYKDWVFHIQWMNDMYDFGINPEILLALQIEFAAIDSFTGKWEKQYSRKWILEPKDESELLRTVWLAITVAEEHEARELFTYQGRHIFGPHKNHVGKAQRADTTPATT